MRRVLVVGSPGSGKSTLARALGARLGLPVVHLDRHYWRPGWVPSSREAWAATLDRLTGAEAWVIDGNYTRTLAPRLAAADTAVFLDRSRWLCLGRVLRRRFRYRGRARPDVADGCPEQLDGTVLHHVLAFPHVHRPHVVAQLEAAERAGVRVVRLHAEREVAAFLEGLGRGPGAV